MARGHQLLSKNESELDVKLFLAWLSENTTINSLVEVTPAQLQQYQIALYHFERRANNDTATKEKAGRRLSVGTQANRLAAVSKFFSWLLSEQQIAYNPASTLQLPKQPQRLPRGVLTRREARRLIEATSAVKPRDVRDRAILETLYATGIRRAELIALTIYDADLQTATLKVEGKGRRQHVVPLTNQLSLHSSFISRKPARCSSVTPARCVCLSQPAPVVHSTTLTSCALWPKLLTEPASENTSRRTRCATPAP